MAGRFSVEAVFKAVDRVTAPISRMQNRVSKFTRGMTDGLRRVDRAARKMGRGLKNLGAKAAVTLAAVAAGFTNVIGAGVEFGRAIGSAAAKFSEPLKRGTEAFARLEQAARSAGATTEFTATQAAGALKFLAKAGFTAEQAIAALPSIIDFATAAELDLAEASDIASDAIGAFGLDSADPIKKLKGLQRVMDVMIKTSTSTNTSVSELFEAMKEGGAIANQAGVSIETFAATMGFLASSGIKASKAGTAAKNITLALAGVGNQAAKMFRRLRISTRDSNNELRDQFDVLDDLRKAMKDMGSAQRISILNAIFGKIPLAAASVLIGDTEGAVRGLRKELIAAAGVTPTMAGAIRNDVKGSLDGLKSAIDGVKISIFSMNEGPLKDVVDRMTAWVRANEDLIAGKIGEFLGDLITNLGEIVNTMKNVAIALGAFIAFKMVLSTLVGVMTLVNLVMAANPLVLLVLIVLAATAAFTAFVIWIDEIAESFDNLHPILKFMLTPFEAIITAIKFIKDNIGSVIDAAAKLPGMADAVGTNIRDRVTNSLVALGLSDQEYRGNQAAPQPQVVSPQERTARLVEEHRTTERAEVTIRDETGRAAVTQGNLGGGLQLQASGEF